MTEQQMNYALWQRMRQQQLYRQQLYRAYAGCGKAAPTQKNSYDKLLKVADSYFLNYLEYSPKSLDSKKAVEYLKAHEDPSFAAGRCTGVYDKASGKVLRQLDWYYNNEAECIVKMNTDPAKGIYGSIGVTAASPKLTTDIIRHCIQTGQYYDYFDVLPFFTVDGVNENGVFAQSNVVMKNGVEININDGTGKEDCCVVMLVRYILDHFNVSDVETASNVKSKLMDNLHIYGTTKLGGYNPHVLIACHRIQKSYVIEFTADDMVVNEFPIMTNFRTFKYDNIGETPLSSVPIPTLNEFKALGLNNWKYVEKYGIGLDRWDIASEFLSSSNENAATDADFKDLREKLNYVHAYDRYEDDKYKEYWYTDNLSGDLTVWDMKKFKNGEMECRWQEIPAVLNEYRYQFEHRSRTPGEGLYTNTWHTTHGAIYDLVSLSCNIASQIASGEESQWNVLSSGQISKVAAKVSLTVHKAYDSYVGSQAQIFIDNVEKQFDVTYNFDKGTTIELKAFPPEDYAVEKFLHWSDDPEHIKHSSVRQLTLDRSIELTAMFHANDPI